MASLMETWRDPESYQYAIRSAEAMPCPWCNAMPGNSCRTPTGFGHVLHQARRQAAAALSPEAAVALIEQVAADKATARAAIILDVKPLTGEQRTHTKET